MIWLYSAGVLISFALFFQIPVRLPVYKPVKAESYFRLTGNVRNIYSAEGDIRFNGIAYGPVMRENTASAAESAGRRKVKSKTASGLQANGPVYQYISYAGSRITVKPEERIFVPFFAAGFYRYLKAGNKVFFHSSDGELLWEKEFAAYPLTDPNASYLLLITGDGNRIDIADRNGNPYGDRSISGNILTQIRFSDQTGDSCIAFGKGGVYFLDPKGKIRNIWTSENENSFAKSCIVSADGIYGAVHEISDDTDYLHIIKENKQFKKIKLPSVYPHNLHMAVNGSGILVAAPDRTLIYLWNGESRSEPADAAVYRAVAAPSGMFAYGKDAVIAVTDRNGNLYQLLPGYPDAFRFITREKQLIVHHRDEVIVYSLAGL